MENEKRIIRKELLYLMWFIIGFVLCFILFVIIPPYISQKGDISSTTDQANSDFTDNFITFVEYADNGFRPNAVTIRKGNYIVIRNISTQSLVWLSSDNSLLSTTRGYAQSEQIRSVLNDEGVYIVTNKLNLSHKLTVVVR